MIRTNLPKLQLPDAINCSISKEFTQIPNQLLRNPAISGKAKALLCLLLSNREGWHSCVPTIKTMMKEREEALQSGLSELEQAGYLIRIRFRDKATKVWLGSFWAYTDQPGNFYMEENLKLLDQQGLETFIPNPEVEKPVVGKPQVENQPLIILKEEKNTKKELSAEKLSKTERNLIYLPLAQQLSEIIRTNKNISHLPKQITTWSNSIRRLSKENQVEYARIEIALNWYARHIDEDYVPVIESGSALLEKFIKLEAAMQRSKRPHQKPQTTIGHKEEKKYPVDSQI